MSHCLEMNIWLQLNKIMKKILFILSYYEVKVEE